MIKLIIPPVIIGALVLLYVFFGSAVFKAFPLFLRDCFKLLADRVKGKDVPFNMYGVYLYNGLGGNGKTISIVRKAHELKERYPKLLIMANFHTDVADQYFDKWEDILYTENVIDGVNHGVLILFDEMHLTLNSQGWQNAPDELLEFISLQRHLHKCILGSAQEWSRVSKIIREQVNFIVDCKSYMKGRLIINKTYTPENYIINGAQKGSGLRKRPRESKEVFVGTDKLRSCYDTDEIVKGLKIGSADSSTKMLNRLARALQETAE